MLSEARAQLGQLLGPRMHTRAQALLRQLDGWLAAHDGPFIGGADPSATDCYLAPKLTHAVLALRELRGWELPGAPQRCACFA